MKKVALFILLFGLIAASGAYAQSPSVRLGVSSASYADVLPDHSNASVSLGTEDGLFYVGGRCDFNKDSANLNAQLEIGPGFLRAGPGVLLVNPNGDRQVKIDFGATFKPWRGLYVNSRWAPVSLNNRPNSKNFFDASLGWQLNF